MLWKFLIPSRRKDLLWTEWQRITTNKDGKTMGVHPFARAVDKMLSELGDKQGCKSIADEVKIGRFLNNMPDIIKKSITLHRTDDMT